MPRCQLVINYHWQLLGLQNIRKMDHVLFSGCHFEQPGLCTSVGQNKRGVKTLIVHRLAFSEIWFRFFVVVLPFISVMHGVGTACASTH
jgi:hypothetical protein